MNREGSGGGGEGRAQGVSCNRIIGWGCEYHVGNGDKNREVE